jgi:hypothetical protein
MFASSEESVRRAKEIERLQGITPEIKRRREIKAGVIVSSVGVGLMIFLYFLMEGIILSGDIKPGDEFILSRVWLAGVIPFLVGLALIINGALVSRPDTTSEASKNDEEAAVFALESIREIRKELGIPEKLSGLNFPPLPEERVVLENIMRTTGHIRINPRPVDEKAFWQFICRAL